MSAEKTERILPKKEAEFAARVEKKESSEVSESVASMLKKIFLGLDVESLQKDVDDLHKKELAGTLGDEDKLKLPKLLKIFERRKTQVGQEVSQLVTSVSEGSVTEVKARSSAKKLMKELRTSSVLKRSEQAKLEEVATTGLLLVNKLETKDSIVDRRAGALWLMEAGGSEFVKNTEKRAVVLEKGERLLSVIEADKKAGSLRELKEQIKGEKKKITRKIETRLAINDKKRRGLTSIVETKKVLGKGERSERVVDNIDLLGKGGGGNSQRMRELMGLLNTPVSSLDNKDKGRLRDFAEQMEDVKVVLNSSLWERVRGKVGDLSIKNTRKQSKWEIAGVELAKSRGSVETRIKKLIREKLFDPMGERDVEIPLLVEAISPGEADPNSDAYRLAGEIWGESKNWIEEYGEFAGGVEDLLHVAREKAFVGVEADLSDYFEVTDMLDGYLKAQRAHQIVRGHDKDTGEPIYTPEGKELMRELGETQLVFDDDGNIVEFNTFEKYVRESQQGMSKNQMAEIRKMQEQNQREMAGIPKEEVNEWLKKRIVDKVMDIVRTGDASRAPGNQMASYELFDLLSKLDEKGEFKDRWMARLAMYDIGMYMGGVESYDELAKVASFLPKEYLDILQRDQINLGEFRDVSGGAPRELSLSFADMLTAYQEQVPGSKDVRDIWLAKVLGSKNLTELDLNKRRLMAYQLGKVMGAEFQFSGSGESEKFVQTKGPQHLKDAIGRELSTLQMVGLDENGGILDEVVEGKSKVDFFADYSWYMNMPLNWMHIHMQSVGLERGGNNGSWWTYLPNGLRKIHGAAQAEYHKNKHMSKKSAVDDVDSGWRSFLAWKVFAGADKEGNKVFFQKTDKLFVEKGVSTGEKDKYYEVLKQALYLPEYWKNRKIAGELRSIAEVRQLAQGGGEYEKVKAKFLKMEGADSFEWKELLEQMGMNVRKGDVTTGEGGLKLFLENFNLERMIDYGGLPHNFWADWIKYSGYASEFWGASVPYGGAPWDPGMQKKLADQVGAYYGLEGKAWKGRQVYTRQTRNSQKQLEGTETYINDQGVEDTQQWKIDVDDNSPEIIEEKADVARRGWRIGGDGYVYDENGQMQYRRGKVKFTDGLKDPFAVKSWGSTAAAAGYKTLSWLDRKRYLKGYLKADIFTKEQWAVENKRLKYAMYFGAEIPDHEDPSLDKVLEYLRDKPWRMGLLPLNILRGIWTDLGMGPEDVVAFSSPMGKAIGQAFSTGI